MNQRFSGQNMIRISSTNDIYKIEQMIKQLNQQSTYRLAPKLQHIMGQFFGNNATIGVLKMLYDQAITEKPVIWAEKMDKVIKLIGPDSIFVKLLKKNKYIRLSIEKSYLPCHISSQNIEDLRQFLGIRDNYGGVSMPALDWYFVIMICKIYNCESIIKLQENLSLLNDDFHYNLIRNPYLVLLRQNLRIKQNEDDISKLVGLMRLYLIDGLIYKYQRQYTLSSRLSSKQKNYRFDLRPVSLLAIYLGIRWRKKQFNDLQLYYQAAIQFYQQINNSEDTLRYLIRVWLYYIGPQDQIQSQVIKSLQKANTYDCWFQIKRYQIEQLKIKREKHSNSKIVEQGLFKLFRYDNNWIPNLTYLNAVASFIYYLNKLSEGEKTYGDCIKDDIGKIMTKFERRIPQKLLRLKKKKDFPDVWRAFEKNRKIIKDNCFLQKKDKFLDFTQEKLNEQVLNIDDNTEDYSGNQQKRKVLVNYYVRTSKNCWEIPIQPNQMVVLYYFFYNIALIIDKIRPGQKSTDPKTNIRFLANPVVFLLFLLAIYIVLRILL